MVSEVITGVGEMNDNLSVGTNVEHFDTNTADHYDEPITYDNPAEYYEGHEIMASPALKASVESDIISIGMKKENLNISQVTDNPKGKIK